MRYVFFLLMFFAHVSSAEPLSEKKRQEKLQLIAEGFLSYYKQNAELPVHRYQLADFLKVDREAIKDIVAKEDFLELIQRAAKYENFKAYVTKALLKIFTDSWLLPSEKIAKEKLGIPKQVYALLFKDSKGVDFLKDYGSEKAFEAKDRLIRKYIELAKVRREYPEGDGIYGELLEYMLPQDADSSLAVKDLKTFIKAAFAEGAKSLKEAARSSGKLNFVIDRQFVNPDVTASVLDALNKYDRFLISAIPDGYPLTEGTRKAWEAWCKANDGVVLLLPLEYTVGEYDPAIAEKEWIHLVFDELKLSPNLTIAGLPVTRKMLDPTASTQWLGSRSESLIIGAPRLMAETFATSENKLQSKIVMTTGAAEAAIYQSEFYTQLRLSKIAEQLHQRGALILEKSAATGTFSSGGLQPFGDWYMRHVEMTEAYTDYRGREIPAGFTDLNRRYTEEGKVIEVKPYAANLGDLHFPDMTNLPALKSAISTIKSHGGVEQLYLQDVVEGTQFNRHLEGKTSAKSKLAPSQRRLDHLLREYVRLLNWLLVQLPETILVIVESNHPEWFNPFIESVKYGEDPQNFQLATEIHAFAIKHGVSPIHAMLLVTQDKSFRQRYQIDQLTDFSRLVLSKAGDGMKTPTAQPVTTGHHGHQGANGSTGTKNSKRAGDDRAVTGHTHTYRRAHNVIEGGTMTQLDPEYTRGGYSSWVGPMFTYIYSDGAMASLHGNRQSFEFARPNDAPHIEVGFFAPDYPRAVPVLVGSEHGASLDPTSVFSRANRGELPKDDPRKRTSSSGGTCKGTFLN